MATPYPIRPSEADCRDYLRTGRCKYGESCKYHHPANVENGGGVKPIDPSEPLFPVRPMEPPCQYFLKHGTCKFGQSCKFNHPSGSPLAGDGGHPAGQLVFVTTPGAGMPGDATSSLMSASTSVQVLPQRPTEPNCIYFLRNGKCKYGATCKFHHPLDAINRNNQQQVQQHMQNAQNNVRDRSHSGGSLSDVQRLSQMQHASLTYAPAANVSYAVQQPHRLQPITERVPRPHPPPQHQPRHILLPDGQIAVILDPQSLQNLSELNAQDRPKFYMSQSTDVGSIGTLPSMDNQSMNHNPVVSPMLTATTNSTSNNTFDSSIDMGGANVSYNQGQHQALPPRKSFSGGSLSAYGSVDSGSHIQQGDYPQQVSNQMPLNMGPQYSAWPMHNEDLGQATMNQQAQVRRSSPGSADALVHPPRHVANLESTAENTAAYYWPSSGSFSSIPVQNDQNNTQARSYSSMPNSSPHHRSSNAVGSTQANINRSYSAEPDASNSLRESSSSEQNRRRRSSNDDEGLTMMTSALLTMMDRHESPPVTDEYEAQRRTLTRSYANNQGGDEVYTSQSEPNLLGRGSPMRPPPGMMTPPPGMSNGDSSPYTSSNFNTQNNVPSSRSPPGGGGGGYFVGGYDHPAPNYEQWWG